MALNRIDETDLLSVLHGGIDEHPRWSTFLDRLRRRMLATQASILIARADAPGAGIEYLPARRPLPPEERPHLAELYRLDPARFHRLRPGRVYEADTIAASDSAAAPFPAGSIPPFLRVLRVAEPEGLNLWIAVSRATRDFSAGEGALLSSLGAHLAIAASNLTHVEQARFAARTASAALRRLGFGWIILDAAGGTIAGNPPRGRGGRAMAMPPVAAPGRRTRVLPLAADGEGEAVVVPAGKPVAIITGIAGTAFLRGGPPGEADAESLAGLFGLSPKEAALACALARGESIAGAGAALGLTLETARNYSKRLYAKTGTRGQADLVRRILGSVAMLA